MYIAQVGDFNADCDSNPRLWLYNLTVSNCD